MGRQVTFGLAALAGALLFVPVAIVFVCGWPVGVCLDLVAQRSGRRRPLRR